MSEEQSLCHSTCHHEHDHNEHNHNHNHIEVFQNEILEPKQTLPILEFITKTQDFKFSAILSGLYLLLSLQALLFGLNSSSVHLTEESFDCILNSIVIGFAIYCGIKAKTYKSSQTYPFAMQRLEYLSSFTLCIHIIILTMFQISRNAHEILEDLDIINHYQQDQHEINNNSELYYATLRIVIAFSGIFIFVEYLQPNFTINQDQLHQFIYNYKNLISTDNCEKYFYTHYLNMHAISILLFSELLFNIGTFLECMLDTTLSISAMGTIIAITYAIIISVQLKPLMITSIQALLLATNDKFENLRYKLSDKTQEIYIWNHGASYNCIIVAQNTTNQKRQLREQIKEQTKERFKNLHVHIN